MNDDAIQVATELAGVFDSLEVPYMIGGSLASTVWGEPRFTQDVDLVAALKNQHVLSLIHALGAAWYSDEGSILDAIDCRSSFHLIRLRRMIKVDVFVPPDEGLHLSKWDRVCFVAIDPDSSRRIAVTSPEDILLQKLDWYRKGDEVSQQQWRDITALLRILEKSLDQAYVDDWARKMDISELLLRARAAAQA